MNNFFGQQWRYNTVEAVIFENEFLKELHSHFKYEELVDLKFIKQLSKTKYDFQIEYRMPDEKDSKTFNIRFEIKNNKNTSFKDNCIFTTL